MAEHETKRGALPSVESERGYWIPAPKDHPGSKTL